MRRQLHIRNDDVHDPVASNQQLSEGRPLQDMPVHSITSVTNADHTPHLLKPKMGIEPWQYSMSERKLRANAFAARVNSLKYYIGLIGTKSII